MFQGLAPIHIMMEHIGLLGLNMNSIISQADVSFEQRFSTLRSVRVL